MQCAGLLYSNPSMETQCRHLSSECSNRLYHEFISRLSKFPQVSFRFGVFWYRRKIYNLTATTQNTTQSRILYGKYYSAVQQWNSFTLQKHTSGVGLLRIVRQHCFTQSLGTSRLQIYCIGLQKISTTIGYNFIANKKINPRVNESFITSFHLLRERNRPTAKPSLFTNRYIWGPSCKHFQTAYVQSI